ncbi:hypothetical protein [Aliiglaciecola litoralis]|uniref:hypothetical protein n=1 Tax=Aliiglaciecola litoralis TaxID=582857 RepID=UPI0031E226AC
MLPFKPFPGFKWVLLVSCFAFALIRPEAAFVSVIWFSFASFYLCNKLSLRVVGKPFEIPARGVERKNIHPFGLLLLVPFFAGAFYPAMWLKSLAVFIRGYF